MLIAVAIVVTKGKRTWKPFWMLWEVKRLTAHRLNQTNERQVEKQPFPHIVRKRNYFCSELARVSPSTI